MLEREGIIFFVKRQKKSSAFVTTDNKRYTKLLWKQRTLVLSMSAVTKTEKFISTSDDGTTFQSPVLEREVMLEVLSE